MKNKPSTLALALAFSVLVLGGCMPHSFENMDIQTELPSKDQAAGMLSQAALIVCYPQVQTIVWSPRYFVLSADAPHIRTIAETL